MVGGGRAAGAASCENAIYDRFVLNPGYKRELKGLECHSCYHDLSTHSSFSYKKYFNLCNIFKKNLIKGYDSFLMSPSVMSTWPLMGCLVSLSVQSSLHLFTRAAQQYWQQYPLRGRRIRGVKCIRGK